MGKKHKLPKPTLAESKAAIAFGGAFLLMCVGGVYAVSTFHHPAQFGPI